MKKLMSMVDFVLEQNNIGMEVQSISNQMQNRANRFYKIVNYANLLKQPLTLGMFIPVDEEGNVLEEPKNLMIQKPDVFIEVNGKFQNNNKYIDVYSEAKQRVLFEGFEYNKNGYVKKGSGFDKIFFDEESLENGTIEDLVKYNLTLTESAIKQLEL